MNNKPLTKKEFLKKLKEDRSFQYRYGRKIVNNERTILPPCHYGFECWTRPLSIEERMTILKERRDEVNGNPIPSLEGEFAEEFLDQQYIPKFELSLKWNQRSADFPLGVPFNLACYGLLLLMLADEVRMVPGELVGSFTDCHIYENQIDGVKELLTREPKELPTVTVRDGMYSSIDSDYDIEMENYVHHPTIHFPLTN